MFKVGLPGLLLAVGLASSISYAKCPSEDFPVLRYHAEDLPKVMGVKASTINRIVMEAIETAILVPCRTQASVEHNPRGTYNLLFTVNKCSEDNATLVERQGAFLTIRFPEQVASKEIFKEMVEDALSDLIDLTHEGGIALTPEDEGLL